MTRMCMCRFGAALAALAIVAAPAAAQSATAVSAEEFAALRWLEGRWVGSGGGVEAFYEQFRVLPDGTIEQTLWGDSAFTERAGRATIEHRGDLVMKVRAGEIESVVTELREGSVRFEWAERGRPGFTWTRVSDDEWYAVLDRPGGAPLIYNMRRAPEGG